MPSGRSSGRSRRTPSGTRAAKSSSIDPTPIVSSISLRSSGVTAVYRLMGALLQLCGVRSLVEEGFLLGRIREPHLHEPARAVRVGVDRLRIVGEVGVDLHDL